MTRSVYWEGGPYFILAPQYGVEVIAQYPDQTPAAVRTSFGHGRVFVSGPHPEAPQKWRDYFNLEDPDGLDADLAQDMVEWAASLH